MRLSYKLWTRPDGTVEPITSLFTRGWNYECITQGNGVVNLWHTDYVDLPNGDRTDLIDIQLEHLKKIRDYGNRNIWDSEAISKEWGRLGNEDEYVSKRYVLERINSKLAEYGYKARFVEGTSREISLYSVLYVKTIEPVCELLDMVIKSKLLGIRMPTEKSYPQLWKAMFEAIEKSGVMGSTFSIGGDLRLTDAGLVEHMLKIKWPLLCTEVGLRNYLGDLDRIIRFEVKP